MSWMKWFCVSVLVFGLGVSAVDAHDRNKEQRGELHFDNVEGVVCNLAGTTLMVRWDPYTFRRGNSVGGRHTGPANAYAVEYGVSGRWYDSSRRKVSRGGRTSMVIRGLAQNSIYLVDVDAYLLERPSDNVSDDDALAYTPGWQRVRCGRGDPEPGADASHYVPWFPRAAKLRVGNPTSEELVVSWLLRDSQGQEIDKGELTVPGNGTVDLNTGEVVNYTGVRALWLTGPDAVFTATFVMGGTRVFLPVHELP